MIPFSLVAAADADRGIGKDGDLPWKLPSDMAYFRRLTQNTSLPNTQNAVIMGRKTYDSIGRPLPGRTSVVLSRNPEFAADSVIAVDSFSTALERTAGDSEVFVTGGESLYELALPRADRLYLTYVHAEVEGDTYFPHYDENDWLEVSCESYQPDEINKYAFHFSIMERK